MELIAGVLAALVGQQRVRRAASPDRHRPGVHLGPPRIDVAEDNGRRYQAVAVLPTAFSRV